MFPADFFTVTSNQISSAVLISMGGQSHFGLLVIAARAIASNI
jgi:hypothetical protein